MNLLHSLNYRSYPVLWAGILVFGLLFLSGCDQTGQLIDQPRYDPLQASEFFPDGRSARIPPAGVVPYFAEGSPTDPKLTGMDENGEMLTTLPVEVTQDLVGLGQERYNIYCVPCHGPAGEGNGKVTGFGFEKPPSLLSDEAKSLTDGAIFEVIAIGKGKMFPYGYRVKPDERWAVISYIRALQLKNGAVNPADLTPDELNQLGGQP
ncbi:MAG: cytochrome c [Anaerolineaceae bacterium]|nr:cytochrome c [Anaerolineaceae bacterium]